MPPLYILRHGQTVWNVEGRLQGRLDSALTPLGQVQAARQGAILRRLGVTAPVLVSPLGRARATAALAGLSADVDDRLAEIDMGRRQGRTRQEMDQPPGPGWRFDSPDGETRAALTRRVDGLLGDLRKPAILVTHGVTGIALRAVLTGRDLSDWDWMTDPQGVVHRIEAGEETVLR